MSRRERKSYEPSKTKIPTFPNEDAERTFWATHDSSKYVDWATAAQVVFPALKPSTETISLRLPASLLADLKVLANRRDVPYQSLLKVFLGERVDQEIRRAMPGEQLAALVREPEPPCGAAPAGAHRRKAKPPR